jgi:hypothetical protein
MKNSIQDYQLYEQILKAQQPKKDTRYLPTFDCKSCGNCEKDYHKQESSNVNNGFCVKFFQNVCLDEINMKCWTSKQHTYYEDISKLRPTEKKADLHKRNKRAKKLKIEFNQNELNLFS